MPYSPRSGDEDHMIDRMFARLEPDVGETVEQTYERRRSADLDRALRMPHAPSSRLSSLRSTLMTRRTRLLISGGTAVAGLAAAAIIVPGAVSGHAARGKAPVTASGAAAGTTVDAHSFLLTAAETAVQEPARSGEFWYTETRTTSLIRSIPSVYQAKIEALRKELTAKETAAHGDAAALRRARRETDEKVRQVKLHSDPPFSATSSETGETWRARQAGGANRNVTRPDTKVAFGSAQDEASWKAMGSPALVNGGQRTSEDHLDRVLSIPNPSLTIRNVSALPTSETKLKSRLEGLYKERSGAQPTDTFATYLWQTGTDLLTAPITPGTRAALFRVLAEQHGLEATSQVRDAAGRRGVALSLTAPGDESTRGDVAYRMIIDPRTAELLQIEVKDQRPVALLTQTFERMGWVDRLGRQPQG
ncbi:hypothetical protein GCM10027176_38050 [Actinoallomurus bryophytorum]|uniref:CU044_5270 family protein n=1 Tax=Actinoallomurus bryophytorum TaxID=1490222 RepID=A0A543CJ47_9ACTN|nr:hypothetical protein [Actinoallomurus bryophytorum]TQL97124.1 hypothetical protein FB559_2700 [Actinoallomurus bryophytorum]